MERIAIYPGSFDPVTNGHLDIVKRGLKLFDRIIVTILLNPGKKSLFTVKERVEMLELSLKNFPNTAYGLINTHGVFNQCKPYVVISIFAETQTRGYRDLGLLN